LTPVTTVSLRVAQFIARHKPFVADVNVPIPVIGKNKELTLIDVANNRKQSYASRKPLLHLTVACASASEIEGREMPAP